MSTTSRRRKGKALQDTATTTALAVLGGKPAIAIRAVMGGYRARQERRIERLCEEILRDAGDQQQLAGKINAAMLADGDAIGDTFVAAARAAAEAVDPTAIVSIALLARHFFTFLQPSRRELRAYLDWFEALDAEEFRELKTALRVLRTANKDPIRTQIILTNIPAPTMTWELASDGGRTIVTGPRALAVYRGFETVLDARGLPEMTSRQGVPVPRDVVDLLSEVVPDDA